MRTEVLVVGGGISGSTLAYLLSRKGFSVTLVDRRRVIGRPHHCSGILGPDALNELVIFSDEWIVGEINWATFTSPGGVEIEVRRHLAKVVDRSEMDRGTWEAALSEGAKGVLSAKFRGLRSKNEASVGGLSIEYDLLVGADGALSSVAEELGFPPMGYEVGMHKVVRGGTIDGYRVRVRRGSRFSWIQPWKEGRKVGALGEIGDPLIPWIEDMLRGEAIGYEGGVIPIGPRRRFWMGNVALVGDAAGQVKPISRGGVLLGVRGARHLAGCLEDLDRLEEALRCYESRWWGSNRREISLGWAVRRYLDSLSDRQIDQVFALLREEGLVESDFQVDRQSAPLKLSRLPKILKLASVNIGSAASALAEALKYMLR